MKKVNLTNKDIRLVHAIGGAMDRSGFDIDDLADALHVDPSTLRRRFKKPGKFTVEELRLMGRRIGLDFDDLKAAF